MIDTKKYLEIKANSDVAPHAGAWIETLDGMSSFKRVAVAPHAGAWIETFMR